MMLQDRISTQWLVLNAEMHKEVSIYGCKGDKNAEAVRDIMRMHGCRTALDYGCGKGALAAAIGPAMKNYDPAIFEFSDNPEPADLVTCTDVMEHIEPEFVDNVLRHIAALSRKVAYFVIACRPASKQFSDGTNTHASVHPPTWWRERVGQFFEIENVSSTEPETVAFLCKPRA